MSSFTGTNGPVSVLYTRIDDDGSSVAGRNEVTAAKNGECDPRATDAMARGRDDQNDIVDETGSAECATWGNLISM